MSYTETEWACQYEWPPAPPDRPIVAAEETARHWVKWANESPNGKAGHVKATLLRRTVTTSDWEPEAAADLDPT